MTYFLTFCSIRIRNRSIGKEDRHGRSADRNETLVKRDVVNSLSSIASLWPAGSITPGKRDMRALHLLSVSTAQAEHLDQNLDGCLKLAGGGCVTEAESQAKSGCGIAQNHPIVCQYHFVDFEYMVRLCHSEVNTLAVCPGALSVAPRQVIQPIISPTINPLARSVSSGNSR